MGIAVRVRVRVTNLYLVQVLHVRIHIHERNALITPILLLIKCFDISSMADLVAKRGASGRLNRIMLLDRSRTSALQTRIATMTTNVKG